MHTHIFSRRHGSSRGLAMATMLSLILSSFGVFIPVASAAVSTNVASSFGHV